jgi:hypothetical protein
MVNGSFLVMQQNKTIRMKLYTEEQVKEAMFLYKAPIRPLVQQVLEQLTPIELPSDEEVDTVAEKILGVSMNGFRLGAKWMKEQILNQNK